jgi:hypothetical protein
VLRSFRDFWGIVQLHSGSSTLVHNSEHILSVSSALDDLAVVLKSQYARRITYYHFCGIMERTKYYAIWTLTEVYSFFPFSFVLR